MNRNFTCKVSYHGPYQNGFYYSTFIMDYGVDTDTAICFIQLKHEIWNITHLTWYTWTWMVGTTMATACWQWWNKSMYCCFCWYMKTALSAVQCWIIREISKQSSPSTITERINWKSQTSIINYFFINVFIPSLEPNTVILLTTILAKVPQCSNCDNWFYFHDLYLSLHTLLAS